MDFGVHLVIGIYLDSTKVFGCEAVKKIFEPPSKVHGGGPPGDWLPLVGIRRLLTGFCRTRPASHETNWSQESLEDLC